jgi:hypothetical protein
MLCLSYYLLRFLFNKIREQDGGSGSAQKWAQNMYTQVSKYKNDKIKKMVFMNLACVAGQLGTTN